MNSRFRYRLMTAGIVLALGCGSVIPAAAADEGTSAAQSGETIAASSAIGSVTIGEGSYIELKDAVKAPGDDGATVLFTLTVHNGSSQELQFIDYWVRLAGSGGKAFTVNLQQQDKDKNRIAAQSEMDVHFYAKVTADTALSDLTFTFIKWDFSVYNYERKLGTVTIPDTYSNVTPVGAKRIVPVSGTPLKLSANKLETIAADDNQLAVVSFGVENNGYKSVAIPGYTYAIVTSEGYVYPLDASSMKDASAAPMVGKQYRLTATVPNTVKPEGWKLVVTQNDDTLKVQVPVASFELPKPSGESGATPAGGSRTIDLPASGTTIAAAVKRKVVDQNADNYLASVVLSLENTGLKSAAVPNYGYAIRTSEGYQYPLDTAGVKDVVIAPKVKKDIQLNAAIPKTVKKEGWKLVMTQTDEAAKVTVPVASFELPAEDGDAAAGVSDIRTIDAAGAKLSTNIARVSLGKSDTNYWISVFFNIDNMDAKSVVVPNYTFRLLTADGLVYPQSSPALNNLSLTPKSAKEVQLSFTVPTSVSVEGLQLQVLPPKADGVDERFIVPVATFKVPKATVSDVSLGVDYTFANKAGSYAARLNAIQRLPWDDQDILAAEVTLGNKGTTALPIPDLQAYFMLDGGVKVPATLYQLDQSITVPGGAGVNMTFYAKMPYTTSFADLKLVLQEKVDDKTANTVAEFRNNADLLAVPVIAKGGSYKLSGVGKTAELTADKVLTYAGVSNDLFYAELKLKNLEKRLASAGKLFGYFKTQDNMYFPITITSVTQKISPGAQAVIALWGELPKGLPLSQLDLLIGEALPGASGAGGTGDAAAAAYVRAVDMQLPDEITAAQSMESLRVGPYALAIRNIKSMPQINSFSYSFDYKLSKDPGIAPELAIPHKLVLELSDSQGRKYEQSFDMEKAADADKLLTVGSGNMSFTITDSDVNFFNKTQLAQDYTLKVYDEFKGYRRLLTTQSYKWMNLGLN